MRRSRELPKYVYARGNIAWVRFKDEHNKWINKSTGFKVDDEENIRRCVRALLRGIERKRERGDSNPETVADYAKQWLAEREKRGLGCAQDDRRNLEKYALPEIGHITIEQLRPRHVRDMVRKLVGMREADGSHSLAPRTVHHIFNALRVMMRDAIVEEIYFGENPVKVKPGELPKKLDADPEWRSQATFQRKEVLQLVTGRDSEGNAILPIVRRVQYALKALAGLRHGEAAALCVRHRDKSYEPLVKLNIVQAWDSRKKVVKRTKTGETREVPEHPVLTQILNAWLEVHWPRLYGRKPMPDDFIIPTLNGTCLDPADANDAFKRDLAALGLRVEAGVRRDRGGHDLRGWFKTQTLEDGADSLLIRRVTHAPPKDVEGGYQRFSWAALCREVLKLQMVVDGDPLKLATVSLQSEKKAGGRWSKVVTPKGLEAVLVRADHDTKQRVAVEKYKAELAAAGKSTHSTGTRPLQRIPVPKGAQLAGMVERAAREGDIPRLLEIAAQLRAGET
jgi:integrase